MRQQGLPRTPERRWRFLTGRRVPESVGRKKIGKYEDCRSHTVIVSIRRKTTPRPPWSKRSVACHPDRARDLGFGWRENRIVRRPHSDPRYVGRSQEEVPINPRTVLLHRNLYDQAAQRAAKPRSINLAIGERMSSLPNTFAALARKAATKDRPLTRPGRSVSASESRARRVGLIPRRRSADAGRRRLYAVTQAFPTGDEVCSRPGSSLSG